MLQEAFELGERVRQWSVEYTADGSVWKPFLNGTVIGVLDLRLGDHDSSLLLPIGYKQIKLAGSAVQMQAARLTIASAVAQPQIRTFAAYAPCPSG